MKVLISETTREEREKKVMDALALSTLDADMPSDFTLDLMKKYIDGSMEFEDVKTEIYKVYLREIHER